MPSLFFLHNPGGRSVKHMLEAMYPAGAIAPLIENSPQQYRDIARNYSRFRGYAYYGGHYGYCVFEAVKDGHCLVTNFRNPVSRIFSLYYYWRNNITEEHLQSMPEIDAAFVREAKCKSFSDFIRSDNPDLRLYIDNAHFRQIRDTWYEGRVAGPLDFVTVLRRIVGMKWLFFTEFPSISHLALRRAFPELPLSTIPVINESKGKELEDCLSADDIAYLITRNCRDFAIYLFALILMVWRLRYRAS